MTKAIFHTDNEGLLLTNGIPAYKSREFSRVFNKQLGDDFWTGLISNKETFGVKQRESTKPVSIDILAEPLRLSKAGIKPQDNYNETLTCIILCITKQPNKCPGKCPTYLNMSVLESGYILAYQEPFDTFVKNTYIINPVKSNDYTKKYYVGNWENGTVEEVWVSLDKNNTYTTVIKLPSIKAIRTVQYSRGLIKDTREEADKFVKSQLTDKLQKAKEQVANLEKLLITL
jgi:hypothetical protein